MTELTVESQHALNIPTMRCFRRKNQIVFNCPECGEIHHHGIPSAGHVEFGRKPTGDDNGEGHRVSHCMVEGAFPNGYILKLDPDEQALHDDQEGRIFALEARIARLESKVAENFNMEEKEIMKVKEKIEDFLYGSD